MDRPAIPPADLAELPRPILGYVGTLEDRLDWPLLEDVSRAFPKASLVLIGRMPSGRDAGDSRELRDRVVARPNVHAVGWRRQTDLPDYFQSFDVNLIPYRVDHPFNRACSPTKIMDGMGATRPIVSTAVPECRLYTRYMDVADSHDDFLNAIARILDRHSDDGRAELRRGFAAMHTCAATASRVIATMRPRG